MTEEICGDIFNASEEVVLHAVNLNGKIDDDDEISKKFYTMYPKAGQDYRKFINNIKNKKVSCTYQNAVQTSVLKTDKFAKAFTRLKFLAGITCRNTSGDEEIDFDILREALWGLQSTHISFAVPYKFGMNISDKQWEKIVYLLDSIYCDKLVTIYKPPITKQ